MIQLSSFTTIGPLVLFDEQEPDRGRGGYQQEGVLVEVHFFPPRVERIWMWVSPR
jgi:hypothetical protein